MIALYARQSVDKKDSISIESQLDFCQKEIGKQQFKEYIDKGYSGGNINRPGFEQMIDDIKNGLITKVVVYKIDRISRSLLDFANIIELFESHNIEFVSATEKFDTSTPMGRAMLSIIMIFAQLERETIQQRIKHNYYARGKKGFFLGGKTPYGFIKDKTIINGKKVSVLKPNPEEIEHLKKMFELYSDNNISSLATVRDYLNEKGIKSPGGVNWDSIKIQRILRNPVYVKADADIYMYFKEKGCIIANELSDFIGTNGCFLFGKRDRNAGKYNNVENHTLSIALHEGVIDAKTWLACQYKLDKNKQIKNTGKGKYSWLSGLTKCGYCGYAMTIRTFDGHRYFYCRGKSNYKVCDIEHETHHAEDIEEYVEKELFNRMPKIKFQEIKKADDFETNQLKLQLIEIESQIENLINSLASSNNVVMDYINRKITELDAKKQAILKTIKENFSENSLSNKIIINLKKNIKNWKELDLEAKKEIAQSMIEKVIITNENIEIEWKY